MVKLKIEKDKDYIIFGDCLDWLDYVPKESVDTCYIDPPFFSNATYEKIWGNGWERRCFEDRFKTVSHYSAWMEDRIRKIRKCLKPTGSIFVHCDYRANYKLREVLNRVFGEDNFVNEIAWCYRTGGATKKRLSRKHDTIFLYSKTNNYKYNSIKERIYYEKPFFSDLKDENGRYYADVLPVDWWTKEKPLINMSSERLGYQTQKPEALLKRIIECSTSEGNTVLDCFGGGGTTASVCKQLGRRYVTGDVSPVACRVTIDRLAKLKSYPEYPNELRTEQEWRDLDGHTFAEKICEYLGWECNPKKSNDGGVDAWNNNGEPIQIKNHSKPVGPTVIKELATNIKLAGKNRGAIITWDISNQSLDAIARLKQSNEKIEIDFVKVEDILNGILISSDKKVELEQLYEPYKKVA